MSEVKVLSADEAEGMTRAQALRALATGEGVSARDRRMAEIMLEGPEIGVADQHVLHTRWNMKPIAQAVHWALVDLGQRLRAECKEAQADLQELAGSLV